MGHPLISIIIPVYNVAPYIRNCYESVLAQSVFQWEIIFVNDGSVDNSIEIINELSNKDDRVKVISQRNQGVAAARNAGISISKGQYITFLDADDYWKDNILGYISKEISGGNDFDLFYMAHMTRKYPDGHEITSQIRIDETQVTPFLCITESLKSGGWSCVNAIIKRDCIIGKKLVTFRTGIKIGEDADWFFKAIMNCKSMGLIPINYYVYNINREGSAMTHKKLDSIRSYLDLVLSWKNNVDGYSRETVKKIDKLFTTNFIDYYLYLYYFEENEWNDLFEIINSPSFYDSCDEQVKSKYSRLIESNKLKSYLRRINRIFRMKMAIRSIVYKKRNTPI